MEPDPVYSGEMLANVSGYFLTPNLDCERFQDLEKTSTATPAECAQICTVKLRCGGFAYAFDNRYPAENCYPKQFSWRVDRAATTATPGCVSLRAQKVNSIFRRRPHSA
jgi:hypothetical protein